MRAKGHDPSVVLQTSPGHLQAWMHLSTSPLEPTVATAAGQQLAPRLWWGHGQYRLASFGPAGGIHQSEAPAAHIRRLRSLGEGRARPCWVGSRRRWVVAVGYAGACASMAADG